MWLTLGELTDLGLCPSHYRATCKELRVMVAEQFQQMYVFSDLKTGRPVLFFARCEIDKRTLVEMCHNLKEVDQDMDIGIITVERLLEVIQVHT